MTTRIYMYIHTHTQRALMYMKDSKAAHTYVLVQRSLIHIQKYILGVWEYYMHTYTHTRMHTSGCSQRTFFDQDVESSTGVCGGVCVCT